MYVDLITLDLIKLWKEFLTVLCVTNHWVDRVHIIHAIQLAKTNLIRVLGWRKNLELLMLTLKLDGMSCQCKLKLN